MNLRATLLAIPLAAGLGFAEPAWASGPVSSGRTPEFRVEDDFTRGRTVYQRKLVCRSCPYAKGVKSKDVAAQALADVQSGAVALSEPERRTVSVFLTRRFKLG